LQRSALQTFFNFQGSFLAQKTGRFKNTRGGNVNEKNWSPRI